MTQRRPHRRLRRLILFAALALALVVVRRAALSAVPPTPAAVEAGDPAYVDRLRALASTDPTNGQVQARLGLAYLQQARDIGDPAYYRLADRALYAALAASPDQPDALLGQGVLALARHDFRAAIDWAEALLAVNPYHAGALGVLVDAHVELGEYERAVTVAQQLVDRRPDTAAYSRIAYLRELHGDVDGAVEAMGLAADSAVPGTESAAWARVQLGHLYFNRGDLDGAGAQYARALAERPTYPYAEAGVARVAAAGGDLDDARRRLEALAARRPLPEFVIALAEVLAHLGDDAAATRQVEVVGAMQALNVAAGMDVDLEVALFEADWGQTPRATVDRARAAYARRPGVYAADTLAWALYRAGDFEAASRYSAEARRLGTRDALLLFHAAQIADARGEHGQARTLLAEALAINPYFSLRFAPEAAARLAQLDQ